MSVVAAVVGAWVLLALVLVWKRPAGVDLRQAVRLVPDTARLLRRIATDRTIPVRTRLGVWLLLGYLLSPIDLIPDVIPVIGYADDAIVMLWAVRRIIRAAGPEAVQTHWSGDPTNLAALLELTGTPRPAPLP